ncbi:preprotein translocase subunit SecG [Buchnera aphidicola (Periphyllus koelreuteriae)]|uniref:preprotein translocase subunit SecG n=1 Tax=Buchnera aphidicola TaxID=9 RepID=UPI0031B82DB0
MRAFFLLIYLFFSLMLIFLILIQKTQGSSNINITNNKNLFNISTKNEFLTRLTIICSFFFLILSILQCNINNYILERVE